jgi:hypothetical protein
VIYPENFEHKIDFVKVRELLKEHCISELGKDLVEQMRFLGIQAPARIGRRIPYRSLF